jgi:hypothetical protein
VKPVPALALALTLALAGCASAPPGPDAVTCYRAPGPGLADVRRAVLMPFDREAPAAEFLVDVEATFAGELQKERRFEIVPLAESDAALASEEIRRDGLYDVASLLEIARHYRADAALVGTVTQCRPYEPLALGLRAELISVATGEVLWSAEGIFDCAEERTLDSIRRWVEARGGRDETTDVSGWRHYTASIRSFSRFACARIAASLECGVEIAAPPRN